jgi:putative beta-1,4-xylosyltransferase IRX14
MDGIVLFADDSNVHSLDLFDEIQKVKWMGSVSVGILAHSGGPNPTLLTEDEKLNPPIPVQGPACNSSGHLIGWHTFNSIPYSKKSATFVGESATVLPGKMEWSGFVLNARMIWKDAEEGRPEWVKDLDKIGENGEEIESPLALVNDASFVEHLGNCGKKVMLWWMRVEARADSKFPSGWAFLYPFVLSSFFFFLESQRICGLSMDECVFRCVAFEWFGCIAHAF